VISSLLTLLGLASIVAGVVVTAFVRAKKLGEQWDTRGLWAIFGGFGLIMVGVALSISTAPP
jgi:NADH:ubiquinone oxidoreductase subunit 2 (subunit N)